MDDLFLNEKLKTNSFKIPENYFEDLNNKIMSLRNISDNTGNPSWGVPERYFNQLEGQIKSQINLLKTGHEATGFAVPPRYFDSLESKITSKTTTTKISKIKRLSSITRYAAAAIILFFCSITFYYINQSEPSINKQLSSIPDQDIVEYLEYSSDPNDMTLIVENTGDIEDLSLSNARLINN